MSTAEPVYATQPTPGAANELAQVLAAAHLMQRRDTAGVLRPGDLKAHQRLICRVASERTPDGSRYRYPVVVITMPRRAGKTVAVEAIELQRSIMYPGHSTWYTAQTGADAYTAWKGLASIIEDSPNILRETASWPPRMSNGSAEITFRNRSTIHPFTPGPKALDGKNADLVIIDEAFAQSEARGSLLMQSVGPTQLNRPQSQLWIISVAGYHESTWLKSWVERGRVAVGDPAAQVAYLEWSMTPGDDPEDPEVWAAFHSGFAAGLTTLAGMRAARAKHTLAEWRREYCNVWSDARADPIVDLAGWDDTTDDTLAIPSPESLTVALDVAADDSAATIAAGWRDGDTPAVGIVEHGRGTDWLAGSLAALDAAGATIIADPTGPTAVALDALPDGLSQRVRRVHAGEYATACQCLITRARTRALVHLPSDVARTALEIAAGRTIRGTTVLDAPRSPGPICAARAVALALNAASQQPASIQVW